MAVLPESMDRLGPDAGENFKIIERYIRYLSERLEFSMSNLGRTASGAGASAAETVLAVMELQNDLSAVQSALGVLTGDLNGLKDDTEETATALTSLEARQTTLEARQTAAEQAAAALEARVAAIEAEASEPS